MSLWSIFRDAIVIKRKDDEALYAQALLEIEAGVRRHGLWAKALANAGGNEERAKAEYIKLVVNDLRDDRYVERRDQEKLQEKARRIEEQRQLDVQEQQRVHAEQQRAAQKQRVSDLWVWGAICAAILWAWLANREPAAPPVAPTPAGQKQITKPEADAAKEIPRLRPAAPVAQPSQWDAPRYSEPREPCVFKQVMTDEEIRRCRESY